MLKEKGVVPPPASHPPRTRQEAQAKQQEEDDQKQWQQPQQNPRQQQQSLPPQQQPQDQLDAFSLVPRPFTENSPDLEGPSPPESGNDDFALHDLEHAHSIHSGLANSQTFQPLVKESSPFRNLDPQKEDMVHRLLSTRGNLSFDQLSGRIRFFGPTANSHVYAESAHQFDSREPPEQIRRAERIIRSLTGPTYDYLMACFWEYYNSTLQVIDREAFEADRDSQNPKFYSSFLHITILATGYRFADRDREDIRRITVGSRESTLHRESKYMLDIELERPGGIPSVQALLLLGDMECGVGRDNTGWMYSGEFPFAIRYPLTETNASYHDTGMANRLAFDVGLHLDCRGDDIPEREVQIRCRVMRACVLYDKYWALFLGRPTSIKNQDIGLDLLSKRFSMLSSASTANNSGKKSKATNSEVHDQLVELMEIAGKIVDTRENNKVSGRHLEPTTNVFGNNESEENAYLHVISLDRQLQNWYRRLPEHLTWKPANIKAAPFSYFLLHQQYHVSMILLHRPWAKYDTGSDGASTGSHPSPASSTSNHANTQNHMSITNHALGLGDPQSIVDDSRTSLSRSICTQQSIRVARIFWQHRQRFDGRKICVTGIQHAGTSAIALIAALAHQTSEAERRSYLGYLEILSTAISDMSYTYQPASRMDELLTAVLAQLRGDILGDSNAATMPNGFQAGSGTTLPGQTWNTSPGSIYSVLPARRENPSDSEVTAGPQTFKRRRPGTSRRASEFARPPPPYFGAGPTPPHSSGSFAGAAGLAHQLQDQHQHQHQPLMANIFDSSNHYGLDCLNGSGADLDGHDDGAVPGRGPEDYVLVTPSSDGWGLSGIDQSHRQNQQQQQHDATGSFDMPMTDWMAGPASLSASATQKGSIAEKTQDQQHQHQQQQQMSSSVGLAGEGSGGSGTDAGGLGTSLGSQRGGVGDGSATAPNGKGGGGGMEWMGSEGGMNALSPASLSGLVQSLENTGSGQGSTEKNANNNGDARNHELDFFSF
jgi:hypothetical protein